MGLWFRVKNLDDFDWTKISRIGLIWQDSSIVAPKQAAVVRIPLLDKMIKE